jgi:hypothetical protein
MEERRDKEKKGQRTHRNGLPVVLRERGGVEWVLRDGDEDARIRRVDEHVDEQRDTRGGARGEEDIVGRGGVGVSFCGRASASDSKQEVWGRAGAHGKRGSEKSR